MATAPRSVRIDPESEIGLVLRDAAAAGEPILVDAGDTRYELDVHRVVAPNHEQVARAIAGIRKAAGGWRGLIDVDESLAELHERRRMTRRPRDEP